MWAFQSCSMLLEKVCWALGPHWQLHIAYRSSVLACSQWQAVQILQESTCASQAVSLPHTCRPEWGTGQITGKAAGNSMKAEKKR